VHPNLGLKYRHPLFCVPLLTALMALSKLFSWFAKKFDSFVVGSKICKIPTAFRTKSQRLFSKSSSKPPIKKTVPVMDHPRQVTSELFLQSKTAVDLAESSPVTSGTSKTRFLTSRAVSNCRRQGADIAKRQRHSGLHIKTRQVLSYCLSSPVQSTGQQEQRARSMLHVRPPLIFPR